MQVPHKEHLYKLLVIGDLGVGKTSIIKRYVHQNFSSHYRATIGVDFALKVLHWDPETVVRLQLWDIAGEQPGRGWGWERLAAVLQSQGSGLGPSGRPRSPGRCAARNFHWWAGNWVSKKTKVFSRARAETSSAFPGTLGLLIYLPLTASPGISQPPPQEPLGKLSDLHSVLGLQLLFRPRAVVPVTRPLPECPARPSLPRPPRGSP